MRILNALAIAAGFMMVQGCTAGATVTTPPQDLGEGNPDDGSGDPPDTTGGDEQKPAETGGQTTDPAKPPATTPATPPATPPVKEKSKTTFFVTSTGTAGQGGNLGGLAGADKKCQDLATAAQIGDHTWRAYISVQGTNAKDRIGAGPWTNQKGTVIAKDVATLHDQLYKATPENFIDEKGAAVPATGTFILTGSDRNGVAIPNRTCNNWTSANQNQTSRLGDINHFTNPTLGAAWNDARVNANCTENGLKAQKSEGRLYCFAID